MFSQEHLLALTQALPSHWGLVAINGQKAPYQSNWQHTPLTPEQIAAEIQQNPHCQAVGVLCGTLSGGLLFVDHDGASCDPLIESLSGLPLDQAIPTTVSVTSGRPGRYQNIYRIPESYWGAIATKKIKTGAIGDDGKAEQLEFRWDGCQSVVVGAHPLTGRYQWVNAPVDCDVAEAPLWMIEQMLKEPAERQTQRPMAQVGEVPLEVCLGRADRNLIQQGAPAGQRNDAGAKLARNLIGTAYYLRDIGQRFAGEPRDLFDRFCDRCSPPIATKEAEQIWQSATKKSNPTPSLSQDKIATCIKAWEQRQQFKALPGERSQEPSLVPIQPRSVVWDVPVAIDGHLCQVRETRQGISYNPLTNFDFTVERILVPPKTVEPGAATVGGLLLSVTHRSESGLTQSRVLVQSDQTTELKKFVNALKAGASCTLVSSLNLHQVNALIHDRTTAYYATGGKDFRLIDRVGCQSDSYWVFEHCQFTPDGKPCTEEESGWVWSPLLGETEQIPSPQIAPQTPDALPNLVKAVAEFAPAAVHPFIWLTLGYATAVLHRGEVFSRERYFPQLALFGDPGGGKAFAASVACSIAGMHDTAMNEASPSVAFERAKSLGCLPLFFDDPLRRADQKVKEAFENVLWKLYDGKSRTVRGNCQTPHTAAIVTSNQALGDEGHHIALETRLLKLFLPRTGEYKRDIQAISQALDAASGGLSSLIALRYSEQAVQVKNAIREQLAPHLAGAHARMQNNWALLVYYTQVFCQVAGVEFDVLDYVITTICPDLRALNTQKDSLTDFLEKLQQLQVNGLAGEWNFTETNHEGKRWLAIALPDVWQTFSQQFSVNYSRQTIEHLITERGGKRDQRAKFVESKQVWQDYQRALTQFEMADASPSNQPHRPVKKLPRCVVFVPIALWTAIGAEVPQTDPQATNAVDTQPQPEKAILEIGDAVVLNRSRPEYEAKGLTVGQRFTITAMRQHVEQQKLYAICDSGQGSHYAIWLYELSRSPASTWERA